MILKYGKFSHDLFNIQLDPLKVPVVLKMSQLLITDNKATIS